MAHAFAPLRVKCRKSLASAIRSVARVADLDAGRGREPAPRVRLVEVEDERVGPQTRDVDRRVEPFQRIVELVGQEDLLELRLVADLLLPVLLGEGLLGGVEEPVGVGRRSCASPVKPRNVLAMSRNQPYWTVLS